MSRRMSCSMTVEAVKSRQKVVTRRHVNTWRTLKPGDHLTLIEKGMGLPKGAKQVVLAEVEVVSVTVEPLDWIVGNDTNELAAEGFPGMSVWEFMAMWLGSHGYSTRALTFPTDVECRRIEFRYLDGVQP